jgi:hypothetical protein
MLRAGVTSELPMVLDLISARGNLPEDFNLISELTKAGAKHADLNPTLAILTKYNNSNEILQQMCQLFKAGVKSDILQTHIQALAQRVVKD